MTGKKVLLVEDDAEFAKVLKGFLDGMGLQSAIADDGKTAVTLLSAEPCDLIISDIRMPNMSGIELLRHVKKNYSIPFVLMTGFPELANAQEAEELGASGFLVKPFQKQDFADLIHGILPPPEDSAEKQEEEYCTIPIDDFVSGSEIQYDIFVRLPMGKYVKVARSGEKLDPGRIATYKSKDISHLYLRKADFLKYIDFNLKLSNYIIGSDKIESTKKTRYLVHTIANVTQALYSSELNRESFDIAQTVVETAMSALAEAPSLLSVFESMQKYSNDLFAHSVSVALFSSLIAKEVGWKSTKTMTTVAMCGLVHDIGKKGIDQSLLEKPRSSMSQEELKILETHTIRGMEMLYRIPGIPEEVVLVAAQHHEDCSGTGYPFHLYKDKIIPLARLVSVANEFCNIAMKSHDSPGYPLPVALEKLVMSAGKRLDKEFLQPLMRVVRTAGTPPEKKS